jgi:hypothetical protein
MRWIVLGIAALALAGCAKTGERPETGTPKPPVAIESDSITYTTGACFGRCPVFSVTVRPDGSSVFKGERFTAVTGEKAFQLTPAQYEDFAKRLAPYRPESGEAIYAPGQPLCKEVATDLPGVDIRWTRAIGDSQHLYYYFGCDMTKNRAMADALGGAVELLPIEDMIGERP